MSAILDNYRAKIETLKNDEDFMAERSRADKLAYYEKFLARMTVI